MATWIERYRAGEHVEVWSELEALGPGVRKPPHRKAAQDVVVETIDRCRQNVLWLFDGLLQLGYRFHGAAEPSAPDYPLELRIHAALEYVRAAGGRKYRANPWSHPAFAWVEEEEIELPAHHRNGKPGRANYRPPGARSVRALAEMEDRLGSPLPLATRGWFETVGWVDLAGTHPTVNPAGEIKTLCVTLDGADQRLLSGVAGVEFVAFLRHAFAWSGLPGWAGAADPPERELAWLRSKLLPV